MRRQRPETPSISNVLMRGATIVVMSRPVIGAMEIDSTSSSWRAGHARVEVERMKGSF